MGERVGVWVGVCGCVCVWVRGCERCENTAIMYIYLGIRPPKVK